VSAAPGPRLTRRSLGLLAASLAPVTAPAAGPVRVGSKPDTEGTLLGHMILRMLATKGIPTVNRIGLGPTRIIRAALLAAEIDLYPEYTGNGAFFFHMESDPVWRNRMAGWALVKRLDFARNRLVWLACAPADNSWAIAVRADVAAANKLATMADFARWVNAGGRVKLAASAEFVESPAALPAFESTYRFKLKADQIVMLVGGNTAATLRAAAEGISGVNAGMTYGTDGALSVLRLAVMRDTAHAQIVFAPAPVVRAAVLAAYPAIAPALNPVFATLTTPVLRRLNGQIEVNGDQPAQVAEQYLKAVGFLA
jgi:osmoprotectant transport system substrate-binding protein